MKNIFLILFLSIFFLNLVCSVGMQDPFGDYDHDGVLNYQDNCYYVYNPNQVDNDANDFGNCCDPIYILNPHITYCDDLSQTFCGDGICNNGENASTCAQDCFISPICGNNILEGTEQCDYGSLNGILCDNSTSTCSYCSSICNLITLPYNNYTNNSTDNNHTNNSTDSNNKNYYSQTKVDFSKFCNVNWECSGWSSCVNGIQTRHCDEINGCSDQYNKPTEITQCLDSETEYSLVEKTQFPFIEFEIGFMFFLLAIFLIILIIRKK